MFIAIQWTFRDSGSLLSLHSLHLGVNVNVGGASPALYTQYYMMLRWRIGSLLVNFFMLFPSKFESQVHKLYSKPGRGSEHTFRVGNLHSGPPPKDLNTAVSWDRWTILEVDIRQYSPLNHVPVPPKWTNHNRKSATVLKHMCTSFHTDNKATEKESTHFIFTIVIKLVEHSQQLDLWNTQKSYPNQ